MDYVFGRASDLVIGRTSVCSSAASILRQYQEYMGFGEQQPSRFLQSPPKLMLPKLFENA